MAPRTDPNVRKYRIRLLPWVVTPWHLINENDKTLTLKDASMAKRICDDDAPFILSCGTLSADAAKEILDIGREALRIFADKRTDSHGENLRFLTGRRSGEVRTSLKERV
jgi:hypothetical protein